VTIPFCGVPFLLAFGAYVVAGVILSIRMLREGIGGRTPIGFDIYRKESYTPKGQRLFATFSKWYRVRSLLVALGITLLGGIFCNLVGW
jgi:hypothetical protein